MYVVNCLRIIPPCKIEPIKNSSEPITNRIVLAVAHQMFDIIGYTAPIRLITIFILQKFWKHKWDENLSDDLNKNYKFWHKNSHLLSEIKIPRWVGIQSTA